MNNYINDIDGATRLMCVPSGLGKSSTSFVIRPDGTEYAQVFDGDFGLVSPPPFDGCLTKTIGEYTTISPHMPMWENDSRQGSRLLLDPRISSIDWTQPTDEDLEMLRLVAEEFRAIGFPQSNPPRIKFIRFIKEDIKNIF